MSLYARFLYFQQNTLNLPDRINEKNKCLKNKTNDNKPGSTNSNLVQFLFDTLTTTYPYKGRNYREAQVYG
jgi:hypothetical protein